MCENNDSELDISNEISYEEEQLQQLLLQESEKQKIEMDRELREAQEKEYRECLEKDTIEPQEKIKQSFDEPSLKEMREVRLKRFENKLKDKRVE